MNTSPNPDSNNYSVPSPTSWPPERWAAVIVIAALVLLVAIRSGVRGVDFLGARVSL